MLESIRQIVRSQRVASRASERLVGLSNAQLLALHRLASDGAVSLNELAGRTHTHQSSTSVVVSKLVDRRLIARNRSKHDARRLELSITPTARKLLAKAPHEGQDDLVRALAKMSPRDVKQLAALLRRLTAAAGFGRNHSGD